MAETGDNPDRVPHFPARVPGYPHQGHHDRPETVQNQNQDHSPRLSPGPQVWGTQVHQS